MPVNREIPVYQQYSRKNRNKIKGNTDYAKCIKIILSTRSSQEFNGLLSRASGAILNPNLELLFNGPQLRPFNFTFRLSPREEKEATASKKHY
jgi:hypothetical protein